MSLTATVFSTVLAIPLAGMAPAQETASAYTVVRNVHIYSPEDSELRPDQAVLVRGDRILWTGDSSDVEIPEGARVIEGEQRTVLPGLVDMHVHVYTERDLSSFLVHGVTSVRNMAGFTTHLQWRDRAREGELLAPNLYTAGAILDGDPPVWPQSTVIRDARSAAAAVAEQDDEGYDFLKVYNHLSVEAYDALMEAASERAIPVIGHVPQAVGLLHVLESGQRSIEHLSGFTQVLGGADSSSTPVGLIESEIPWSRLDVASHKAVIAGIAESDTWSCPTLVVKEKWVRPEKLAALLGTEEMKLLSAQAKEAFTGVYRENFATQDSEWFDALEEGHANRKRLVKALHDAGAGLVAGTDFGTAFVLPGFSLHEELELFVESGLSPREVIQTATYNAAACLGALDEFGTISPGLRADLILVIGDPTRDISALRNLAGVMVRGRWIAAEELSRMKRQITGASQGGR